MKQILTLLTLKVLNPSAHIIVKHPKKLASQYHIAEVWKAGNAIYISIEA